MVCTRNVWVKWMKQIPNTPPPPHNKFLLSHTVTFTTRCKYRTYIHISIFTQSTRFYFTTPSTIKSLLNKNAYKFYATYYTSGWALNVLYQHLLHPLFGVLGICITRSPFGECNFSIAFKYRLTAISRVAIFIAMNSDGVLLLVCSRYAGSGGTDVGKRRTANL